MRKLTVLIALVCTILFLNAQNGYVPKAELKTLDGVTISTEKIIEPGVLTILVFWNSNSTKCIETLSAMYDIWMDSLEDKGVKMIAICTDCVGSWDHVRPFVNGNSWEFDTYIDVNCDLKRTMCVTNVPCTIMFDQNQNLICRYDGYCIGIEVILCKKMQDHMFASLD